MKKASISLFLLLFSLFLTFQTVVADDLDGFSDLADLADMADEPVSEDSSNESSFGDDFSLSDMADSPASTDSASNVQLNFSGYLKAVTYWDSESYSDLLWGYYQNIAAGGENAPMSQNISGFNHVGTRAQFQLEGFLGSNARLFSAFNLNYHLAGSLHNAYAESTSITTNQAPTADIRMVESYIELYSGAATWKVGSQIVTWGYMEGAEVPTDRVNARDRSYKSAEYEDGKLASTGISFTSPVMDEMAVELMFIPVSRQNVSSEMLSYLFEDESDELISQQASNAKWAGRFSGTFGNLDASISYVDGLDVEPDLTANKKGKTYNRVKSPGLDLQYNLGSVLAKLSYAGYLTEDSDGTNILIKNNWHKYATGAEFSTGGSTINLYAGQILVDDFKTDAASQSTNFLLGQLRETTTFLSGHVNASFLTGDALNMVLMVAGYWGENGDSVQSFAKATMKYKMGDGLDFLFSPMYTNSLDNVFTNLQLEVKYSF